MLLTFGHSTLSEDEAIRVLDSGGVDVLIDVRSHPTSRWEQWRRENLADWVPRLTAGQVQYAWWPELGGWDVRHAQDAGLTQFMASVGVDLAAYSRGAFPKQRIAKQVAVVGALTEGAPAWTNQGLWDYAWFTSLAECQDGIDRLVELYGAPDAPTAAIFCAEAVWWRCHRSMLADLVVAKGHEIYHLQPRWTRHADAIGNRIQRYPEAVRASWSGVTPEAVQL